MFKIAVVAGAIVGLMSAPAARAQDTPTPGAMANLSEGDTTCGEFVAEPLKVNARMEWVLGFLSGANSRAAPPYKLIGRSFQQPATVVGWLQSYCALHSLDTMLAAAEALRRDYYQHEGPMQLDPPQGQTKPPAR